MSSDEVVEQFQLIKEKAGCDDLTAAILTLAGNLSWVGVDLQVSDSGYSERIGGNIADAIGELASKIGPGELKAASPAKPKKKTKKK